MDDLIFRLAQAQARILKNLGRRLDGYEAHLRHHDLRVRAGAMRRQLDSQDRRAAMPPFTRLLVGATRPNWTGWQWLWVAPAKPSLLRRRSRWERLHSSLQALSPKAILARGYALVFDAEGRLVKQAVPAYKR